MLLRAALVVAVTFALAAPAQAQTPDVVILSVGGDASSSDARAARDAVARALVEDGATPVPDADVALSVSPAQLRACRNAACAWELGSGLGVSMVAAVATWADDDGPTSISVSLLLSATRSYSATEDVGEGGLRAAARAAVTGAQDGRRRALLVEGAVEPPPEDGDDPRDENQPEIEEPDSPLTADRSLEEWILPSLLGVVGIGLIGLSVYALLDEMCELRGPSGDCLRGSAPNIGLGIVTSILGGLSVAGAILWLIIGGTPSTNMSGMDVVLGPDGGYAGWRGRF